MKKLFFLMLSIVLVGCQSSLLSDSVKRYEVRMMNGDSLFTCAKPKLTSDGFYRFKDIDNQHYAISQDLVLYIEPAAFKK